MYDSRDLAYTGGLVDGEGCICIHKREYHSGRSRNPQHSLEVNITNTDGFIILWLDMHFGGHVGKGYRQVGNRKKSYRWSIYGQEAIGFLKLIQPYLKSKDKQAALAIEFQAKIGEFGSNQTLSDGELAIREADRILMNQLNKRGVN